MAELSRDTRQSLPIALLRAREAVMARFRPMLADYGLNEQQWRVIRVLAEGGATDAGDLARRAAILAPSLTRMIRTMTARGIITRSRSGGDGRRLVIALTPQGDDLFNTISPRSAAITAQIETELGREAVQVLLFALHRVTDTLDPGP